MKKRNVTNFALSAGLLILFILYTMAVMFIDLRPIGPQNSLIGLSTINQWIHDLLGVNMTLYNITNWASVLTLPIVLGFVTLVLCIMPTAMMQFYRLLQKKILRTFLNVLCGAFTTLMVVGRLLSGVHWFTDILGGILISAILVMLYFSVNRLIDAKYPQYPSACQSCR